MDGPNGVRGAISDLLVGVLPLKVTKLREAFALGFGQLPDVGTVSDGELPEQTVGGWGATYVEVVNPRLQPRIEWIDMVAGYPQYRMRYGCRIYVWAIGDDWGQAIDRRDHTVNAVRQTLLEYPTLTTVPGDSGKLLHHDTYTEEYGAPVRAGNQSGRTWASALISADLWSEETMGDASLRPPIGDNERTELGMSVLGPTESMPEDLPGPEQFRPVIDATEGSM